MNLHDFVSFTHVKVREKDDYQKMRTFVRKLDRVHDGCVVRILKSGDLKVDTGLHAMGVVKVPLAHAFIKETQGTIYDEA